MAKHAGFLKGAKSERPMKSVSKQAAIAEKPINAYVFRHLMVARSCKANTLSRSCRQVRTPRGCLPRRPLEIATLVKDPSGRFVHDIGTRAAREFDESDEGRCAKKARSEVETLKL